MIPDVDQTYVYYCFGPEEKLPVLYRLCKLYKSLWQIKYGKIIDCYQSIAINKEWSNVPNLLKSIKNQLHYAQNQDLINDQ